MTNIGDRVRLVKTQCIKSVDAMRSRTFPFVAGGRMEALRTMLSTSYACSCVHVCTYIYMHMSTQRLIFSARKATQGLTVHRIACHGELRRCWEMNYYHFVILIKAINNIPQVFMHIEMRTPSCRSKGLFMMSGRSMSQAGDKLQRTMRMLEYMYILASSCLWLCQAHIKHGATRSRNRLCWQC